MIKLVLLRHGESLWNRENRFTGWHDIDLSDKGIKEAKAAGRLLKQQGYVFDLAYTSLLKRAIRTLWLGLDEMDQMWIPVHRHWRLNERHYGSLQGLNKAETAEKYGDDQVLQWRRSYDLPPPALDRDSEFYPGHDPRYSSLNPSELPLGECLKDTVERFMVYWQGVIVPQLQNQQRALIVAHGNSLRALVMHLDNVSKEEIVGMNIPTGIPLVYELDSQLKPIKHYYLGDQEQVEQAMHAVAQQGKSQHVA